MVGTMDSTNLIKRLQRYASKIQGTPSYWYSRYEDLKALLQKSWTVSSADNYWPQLHSLLPSDGTTGHAARVNSVINNPHLTDWYFHAKLTDFVRHWLQDGLGAEWWYEYQATHAHGCASDPGLTTLVSTAALGEQRLHLAQDNDHIIQYGNQAKQLVIKYVDSLYLQPSTTTSLMKRPDPHPCAQRFSYFS